MPSNNLVKNQSIARSDIHADIAQQICKMKQCLFYSNTCIQVSFTITKHFKLCKEHIHNTQNIF